MSYDQFLRDSLTKYKNPDLTKRDVLSTFLNFSDLRPKMEDFVFNDGTIKNLLQLEGTIPVTYKGGIYNIPICFWLMDTHPYNPPLVYLKPTTNMLIKVGRHVDQDGSINIPYMREWRYPNSDLLGMIQILTIVFGEDPPVYSRIAPHQQVPPQQVYTPPPGYYYPSSTTTPSYPSLPRNSNQPNSSAPSNNISTTQAGNGPSYGLDDDPSFDFSAFAKRHGLDDNVVKMLVKEDLNTKDALSHFAQHFEKDVLELGLTLGQKGRLRRAVSSLLEQQDVAAPTQDAQQDGAVGGHTQNITSSESFDENEMASDSLPD